MGYGAVYTVQLAESTYRHYQEKWQVLVRFSLFKFFVFTDFFKENYYVLPEYGEVVLPPLTHYKFNKWTLL